MLSYAGKELFLLMSNFSAWFGFKKIESENNSHKIICISLYYKEIFKISLCVPDKTINKILPWIEFNVKGTALIFCGGDGTSSMVLVVRSAVYFSLLEFFLELTPLILNFYAEWATFSCNDDCKLKGDNLTLWQHDNERN